jgi:hypothetical protein
MIQRTIGNKIQKMVNKYPVLAITGPRQSGKTTLIRNIFSDYSYVSLETPQNRQFAEEDPIGFLSEFGNNTILDEVQRVPDLFSYLQEKVDLNNKMGQYILSGSQNFQLMEKITQSLAGRVSIFNLLPFDRKELKESGYLLSDPREQLIKGFYPAIYDRDLDPSFYYSNYLKTYIERDITHISNIHNLSKFQTFLHLCASRCGQILNLNSVANECGISHPTAQSWLSILESSYIVFLLKPYFENFNKRVIKSPKLYFYDTGIVAYLLGIRKKEDISDKSFYGNLFENLVVAEFMKSKHHELLLQEYWYWRDSAGHEVDLLTKSGQDFTIYEIKSTSTVLSKHLKGLDYFEKITNRYMNKNLIYSGNRQYSQKNINILPWSSLYL